jgi:peroxiredoxin
VNQEFPYRLLSDVDRTVGNAFGAAKGPDEKYPDFPKRLTFLIDPQGVVRKIYEVSDIPAHPDAVLSDITAMAAG